MFFCYTSLYSGNVNNESSSINNEHGSDFSPQVMAPFCCFICLKKPEFDSSCQNKISPNEARAGGTQMVKTGEAYTFPNSSSDICTNAAGCQEMKGSNLFFPVACGLLSSCCKLQQLIAIDCSTTFWARIVPVWKSVIDVGTKNKTSISLQISMFLI